LYSALWYILRRFEDGAKQPGMEVTAENSKIMEMSKEKVTAQIGGEGSGRDLQVHIGAYISEDTKYVQKIMR
jgi:hypothetical protein